jgi:hypothetical protein
MKKFNFKFLFLIIFSIISVKILLLTGGTVLDFIIGICLKFPLIPKDVTYIYLTKYSMFIKPLDLDAAPYLKLLRGSTDFLLFSVLLSFWIVVYIFTYNYELKVQRNYFFLIPFIIIGYFFWELFNFIEDIFIEKPVYILADTFYLKILQIFIAILILLNIIIVIAIFIGKNWSILKKIFFACLSLFYCIIICYFMDYFIIHREGLLFLMLQKEQLQTVVSSFDLLQSLYQSYGLNVAWCNPNNLHPCAEIQERLQHSCFYPDLANKLPFGGRKPVSAVIGTFAGPGLDILFDCSSLKKSFEVCMEEHMRIEFARRWIESHPPITPKPFVGTSVIDTWSSHMKK